MVAATVARSLPLLRHQSCSVAAAVAGAVRLYRGSCAQLARTMETKMWSAVGLQGEMLTRALQPAAALLAAGEVVGIPTETVYGLGGDARSDSAVRKIFAAKGRPADNPLIVHVASMKDFVALADEVPRTAQLLADAFWPGPLTIIVKSTGKVSSVCSADQSTVGIRMPSHPVARELIRLAGVPVAAPSANTSGRPSPTRAEHVMHDLGGRIPGIVDGGETGVGVESTVVDCSQADGPVVILRPGGITLEQIAEVVPNVIEDPGLRNAHDRPRAPGMKYTHYAPRAPVYVVYGDSNGELLQQCISKAVSRGQQVGLVVSREGAAQVSEGASHVAICGSRSDPDSVARGLYEALREFDEHNVDVIFAEAYDRSGIGAAIMDRLCKAAGHRALHTESDYNL